MPGSWACVKSTRKNVLKTLETVADVNAYYNLLISGKIPFHIQSYFHQKVTVFVPRNDALRFIVLRMFYKVGFRNYIQIF